MVGIGINLAFAGVMVAWGPRQPAGHGADGAGGAGRAAALGVAAGSTFGLTAALIGPAVISGLIMAAAVTVLARSPVLSADDPPREDRACTGAQTAGKL
ncbi:MAG TPA: hypothetical protein VG268_22005 [Streptosporangiaceae bacterium]|nr:hypothetical protein [Streptosporangiaceae bacterium]